MKISTIIFDVDGVLIDSNEVVSNAYKKTAKMLGLRIPSDREISRLMGKPLEKIVRILWPKSNPNPIIKTYRRLFMDEKLVINPVDDAPKIVKKLKDSGFKLGIISGKMKFFIDKHLREAGFDLNLFDVIVSFETTEKHKPDPEPILFACKNLGVKPEEVLYVGDSLFDYECANSGKVNYVAALTGSLGERELKKIGVRNILNSVSDLPRFLESLR